MPEANVSETRAQAADVIFHGGEIETVADGPGPRAARPEAVAVRGERIVFVGDLAEALTHWQGPTTRLYDLAGAALLPGFIDPHGHVIGTGLQSTVADLLGEPDGDVGDIDAIKRKLSEFADSEVGQRSAWIIGFGYDDSRLDGKKHPTRADLDEVSTERPVLAIHQSFHLGAVNSKGLELLGYNARVKDPPGGVIRRGDMSVLPFGEPDGVLEETAFSPASDLAIAGIAPQDTARFLDRGLKAAAGFGFTTVQEGAASLNVLDALREIAQGTPGGLPMDVVVYVKAQEAIDEPHRIRVSPDYTNGLRAAGIKLVLDGSPQGRTAWLREPYKTPPETEDKEYVGYPTLKEEVAHAQVMAGYEHDWQVIAHVNGDAAIAQFIRAVEAAVDAFGASPDRRTTGIHCQIAGRDQIGKFRELGIIPSFFSMHTFYWGDWYYETVLGPVRAVDISPAQWALEHGMIYTSHHDAPVARPSSIAILSSQVTRITRSGETLGAHQCVSGLDAVKSITINAAHQYGETRDKGSIEVGKLADLVILSANPATVPGEEIQNITIVETIKAGRTVHPPIEDMPTPVHPGDGLNLFTHHC
ncbi:amidohydrolase [Streptomyces sp. SID3343]|uniref:amidohydrolase n=1 Tax=Streptomyces sp. SID3343 TaxID=2690260 RepID=UPI00136C7C8D|nr:amidohydrolase [Streptomyces sp. SID3343]MYV99630.1 amidohydrolase family protein [Streptomyces sp. SID3343]